MKRVWKINVPGPQGYSFAVGGNIEDELSAIQEAINCGLFDDERDSRYATVEEITDDEYEMRAWEHSIVWV